MSVVFYACSIVLALLAIRTVWDLMMLHSNIRWLDKGARTHVAPPAARFVICIPALYEQEVITKTLDRMLSIDYPRELVEIYVVTTQKEQKHKGTLTTNEVVKKYKKLLPENTQKHLHILNYPDSSGRMAHQINYAAKKAARFLNQENCYFVVYNADSLIRPDIFSVANDKIVEIYRQRKMHPKILQQSAIYFCESKPKGIGGLIAQGAAIHQSRWTLTHELNKLRKQTKNIRRLRASPLNSIMFAKIGHCVGHGLFVKGSHFLKFPLPTALLNEDLPYGLMQCALRNEINPIASLELAASPIQLHNVYRQKSVWFNPFFEFYKYTRYILKSRAYINRFEVYILTVRAYATMLVWLLHSFMWGLGLALASLSGWQMVALWLLILTLYWVVPGIVYGSYVKKHKLRHAFSIPALILGTIYVLTHSYGPILGVIRWVKAAITHTRPDKPKTVNI